MSATVQSVRWAMICSFVLTKIGLVSSVLFMITAAQKDILKAFNMTAANIKEEAIAINDELIQIATRRLQHGTQNNNH